MLTQRQLNQRGGQAIRITFGRSTTGQRRPTADVAGHDRSQLAQDPQAQLAGPPFFIDLQFAMHRGRMGDPWDMAANLLGIAAGVTLAVTRTGGWAPRVEAWLGRN